MREITADGAVLCRYIEAADFKEGLTFFSRDEEAIQAGTWEYCKGTHLKAHIHKIVPRTVERTCEVLYVMNGSIRADIYDPSRRKVETLRIPAGGLLILLKGGHGYEILEDGTRVLEIKNGPYPGPEADRERIEGGCDSI